MARILYLAQDLDDAAIWRRVAMMRIGGASVEVAGFRRGDGPLPGVARVLGRTRNARLGQRALAVLRAHLGSALAGPDNPDAIVARNLEMLALAVPAARRARGTGMPVPRLTYEVLDIHRLMLRGGALGACLRAFERRLCRSVDLVLVSSPAFVTRYFARYGQTDAPVLLVENKVPCGAEPNAGLGAPLLQPARPSGGPLMIGWFGIQRCAVSLACLDALTRAAPGRYRVLLRGRPAEDALPGFAETVARNPDLSFGGGYRYPADLAALYADVDLAWLVDRYDAGENSDWLLPNRLYEAGLNGVPPICLAGTEAARAAAELGIGVVIEAPTVAAVAAALAAVDAARLAELRGAQDRVPTTAWSSDRAECRALVAAITAAPQGAGSGDPGRFKSSEVMA